MKYTSHFIVPVLVIWLFAAAVVVREDGSAVAPPAVESIVEALPEEPPVELAALETNALESVIEEDGAAAIENRSMELVEVEAAPEEGPEPSAAAPNSAPEVEKEVLDIEGSPDIQEIADEAGEPTGVPETETIYFAPGSSWLNPDALETIKRVVLVLKETETLNLQVCGYTDGRGDASVNAIMSKARADKVKARLVAAGIRQNRLEVVTFGESLAEDDVEDGSDRRVELVYEAAVNL